MINIRQLNLTPRLPRRRRRIPLSTIPYIKALAIHNTFLTTPSLLRNRARLSPIQIRCNDASIMRVGVFIATVVWVWAILCEAYKFGEGAEEEKADGGHTGADYADVDFDCGPHACFDVVPCCS